jgi:phosphatidylethanolamine/phosphatidyl-N-methylethanolamine N-methyltransferase
MSLSRSYTFIAPLYDALIAGATSAARKRSLERLAPVSHSRVLISGIGTGLDLAHLKGGNDYVGIDLTAAMLKRARRRPEIKTLGTAFVQGDAMSLPFASASFDWVVMHLILAVVQEPEKALREAVRVLVRKGRILVFDKFLKPDEKAPLRRLVNPIVSRVATRTDVVFETLMTPDLTVIEDRPALARGWFRHIVLEKC